MLCIHLLARICPALLLSLSVLQLSAAPIKPEDIAKPRGITYAVLSPDGKHIACMAYSGKGTGLILVDAETMESKLIRSSSEDLFGVPEGLPLDVVWAGKDLMVVDYENTVVSIDLRGHRVATLGAGLIGRAEPNNPESRRVLVYINSWPWKVSNVDAATAEHRKYAYPESGRPLRIAFDAQGNLRAASFTNSELWRDATTVTNWYRPRDSDKWEKLETFKITDNYWLPDYVPEEEGQLVVTSSAGRDTKALFRYDTINKRMGEMMAGHPSQDILGVRTLDTNDFVRVTTNGMRREQYWFDERWDALQKSVDAALPNRINVLSGKPDYRVLIHSYSDRDPGTWYLLDIATMKLRKVGVHKEGIDPEQMRPKQILRYRARDGLEIPAYLTLPEAKSAPQPTVVLIHGGPIVRDLWDWDAEVQLLASHGFVVFQPQFRGSYGFGRRFEEAGYGQWGLSMQDDITDGVQHLIREGIADPKRICIVGASYGGYAALWGLASTPDLYRCGVSFAGVSDVGRMLDEWSDTNENKIARELRRTYVGSLEEGMARFDAISPVKHADRIKAPVLLMHGEDDFRVPLTHSNKMRAALEAQHKTFEWKTFEKEGHGLYYFNHRIEYYKTLLGFLDKYIGPGQAAMATAGAAK